MLALYKTLREDISEHEVEFLRITENDSMELLAKIHHYQNYDIQSLIDAENLLKNLCRAQRTARTNGLKGSR